MIKKKFSIRLQKIVTSYFKGQFDSSFSALKKLSEESQDFISGEDSRALRQVMSVFYLGQLLDLPSLHGILLAHDIPLTTHQVKYKRLCNKLTNNKLRTIFESIFADVLRKKLIELSIKSDATWSRMEVTAVLDDSVFRQWLDLVFGDDDYYKSWFSGQIGRTAQGYKVLTFGVVIEGVFYPLFLDFVKIGVKIGTKNDAQHIPTAVRAVEKWGKFIAEIEKEGTKIRKIPLSCDNGYSSSLLETACSDNNLDYISVPKKNNLISFYEPQKHDTFEMSIAQFIETEFLPQEDRHNLEQKDEQKDEKDEKEPFVIRKRAFYKVMGMVVTFLFFRLNGSKKVAVIYCPNENMTAKTLRRRWFQRTQIEQFFRMLKHTLNIQAAKTTNKDEFEIKLFRFSFIALHAQLFTRFVRKKIPDYKRFGFEQIRRCILFKLKNIDILDKLMKYLFHPKAYLND